MEKTTLHQGLTPESVREEQTIINLPSDQCLKILQQASTLYRADPHALEIWLKEGEARLQVLKIKESEGEKDREKAEQALHEF
jgi:hypothetical protein